MSKINEKVNVVKIILAPLLAEFNAQNEDPMKGAFRANGQGLDRVLDSISIEKKDASDLTIKLQNGSGIDISKNAMASDAAVTNAASTIGNAVSAIAITMNSLDKMQVDINQAFTLSGSNSSVAAYCHPQFLDYGLSGAEGCDEYLEVTEGALYKVTRPVIIEQVDRHYVGNL